MSPTLRRLAPAGLAAGALLALAACGGGSAPTASDPGLGLQQNSGGANGRQMPGAFGTIAAVAGRTLQVQNQMTGQVAVSYTGTTAISAEVKTTLAGVHVGSCVVVTSDASSSAGAGPVTASAVRITPKTNGSCGLRGPDGGPSGRPSWAPSGRPTGLPSGGPSDGVRRVGFGALGEVTAVRQDGFTIAATRPSSDGASPTTTDVSVSVTGATTYTTTQKATPASLKVGRCVQASGKADDTGAVTATSMTVSDPVDGQCAGFMMRGPQ